MTEGGPELLRAAWSVHTGEGYASPKLGALLYSQAQASTAGASAYQTVVSLTRRERDVYLLLGEGMSNKAIARELGLREKTIKSLVTGVLRKLNVQSRVQAALRAKLPHLLLGLAPLFLAPSEFTYLLTI
jgi:DNA-binding NarL/FixJ family response regulator